MRACVFAFGVATALTILGAGAVSAPSSSSSSSALPAYGRLEVFALSRVPGSISAGHGTVAAGTLGRADFNGDGLVDVVVARALGGPPVAAQDTFPIGILLNDGKGRLLDRPARIFEGRQPRNQWVRQLVVADFNGDGRPDVFLPDTGPEAPNYGPPPGRHDTLILSTPRGRLRDATAGIPQQAAFTHSAAAGDVDGDGDLDLFVGNIGGDVGGSGSCCDVQIWLNDGRGAFAVAADRLPPKLGTVDVYLSSAFTDVDGDRDADLVLAGGHGCALPNHTQRNDQQVLLNDGRGFFRILPGALPQKPFGIAGEGQAVVPADLDRDGRVDLLLAYTSARQRAPDDCVSNFVFGRYVQVLMGNGDGTFRDETASRLPQPDLHGASRAFYLALDLDDLDGDGRPELFTQLLIPPNDRPAYAPAFRNDGRGSFRPLPPGYPVSSLDTNMHAFVDLFGTGRRDVFLVTWSRRGDLFSRRLQRGKAIRPGPPAGVRVTTDPASGRRVVAWPYVWGAARYEVWRDGRRVAGTKLMRWVDTAAPPGARYAVRALN
ncbi:MAG TPA: VCBS repeat-containing protein, partial [Gaiellaceae bacterium]|nr:VCBS repeat-containing protein [Gaiellaceae bacterium]